MKTQAYKASYKCRYTALDVDITKVSLRLMEGSLPTYQVNQDEKHHMRRNQIFVYPPVLALHPQHPAALIRHGDIEA